MENVQEGETLVFDEEVSGAAVGTAAATTGGHISSAAADSSVPAVVQAAVLGESTKMPAGTPQVRGYDFNQGVDFNLLMESYRHTGFQATNLGRAIDEINRMRAWRLSDEGPWKESEPDELKDPAVRAETKCRIFLSYTSNMISCGIRETIRFLVQHKLVDVVITTAGGIEEDLMKCMAPTYMGAFALRGRDLRAKGINRIGNLLVPNNNYCQFEDWMNPVLNAMHDEQENDGTIWSPSKMIHRFGREINHPDSVCYWAYKNNIPIYCPAITDGSVGDMMYFHSYKRGGFICDIAQDIRGINDQAVTAPGATGMIILGGGLVKHHNCNANLMRNGANFSVFINTANEFDGSDSGARPDEAISWGKIRLNANPVKLYSEVSLVWPIIVAQTFAKDFVPDDKIGVFPGPDGDDDTEK